MNIAPIHPPLQKRQHSRVGRGRVCLELWIKSVYGGGGGPETRNYFHSQVDRHSSLEDDSVCERVADTSL